MPLQQGNPALIADCPNKSGGWESSEHHQRDRETDLKLSGDKTLRNQNLVLKIYAVHVSFSQLPRNGLKFTERRWRWERSNREPDCDDCEARALCPGAHFLDAHELKDFWRFYRPQIQRPTWLRESLAIRIRERDARDIEKPKYNFKSPDLDRLIDKAVDRL